MEVGCLEEGWILEGRITEEGGDVGWMDVGCGRKEEEATNEGSTRTGEKAREKREAQGRKEARNEGRNAGRHELRKRNEAKKESEGCKDPKKEGISLRTTVRTLEDHHGTWMWTYM